MCAAWSNEMPCWEASSSPPARGGPRGVLAASERGRLPRAARGPAASGRDRQLVLQGCALVRPAWRARLPSRGAIAGGLVVMAVSVGLAGGGCERQTEPPSSRVLAAIQEGGDIGDMYSRVVPLGLDRAAWSPTTGSHWRRCLQYLRAAPDAPPPPRHGPVTAAEVFWTWFLAKERGGEWASRLHRLAQMASDVAVEEALWQLQRLDVEVPSRFLWPFLAAPRDSAALLRDLWSEFGTEFSGEFALRQTGGLPILEAGEQDAGVPPLKPVPLPPVESVWPYLSPRAVGEVVKREPEHLGQKWAFVSQLLAVGPSELRGISAEFLESLGRWLLETARREHGEEDPLAKRIERYLARAKRPEESPEPPADPAPRVGRLRGGE